MSVATRKLGQSGIEVSVLGLGCNAFGARIGPEETRAVVDAALENGVTFFDTADIYGFGESEQLLGKSLGSRRADVVIATKFGKDMNGVNGDDHGRRGSASYIRKAVEASLRRLDTDWIDLYQMHAPDPTTSLLETLATLNDLVTEGKVRAVGCSNFQSWQLVDAIWLARSQDYSTFATCQNEYSLYNRSAEVELIPACEAFGVGLLPYYPLAEGLLTGKYAAGSPPVDGSCLSTYPDRYNSADWARIGRLQSFADERGITLTTLAIGGLAAQQAVASVISGASRPEQLRSNAAAIAWVPTPADLDELAAIDAAPQTYTPFTPITP